MVDYIANILLLLQKENTLSSEHGLDISIKTGHLKHKKKQIKKPSFETASECQVIQHRRMRLGH